MPEREASNHHSFEHPALEVRKYNLPTDQVVLVGSAALSIYGIPRPGKVEVVVSPEVHRLLRQRDWDEVADGSDVMPSVRHGQVEASVQWNGLTLPELASHAPSSEGVLVAQLEQLVRGMNRRDSSQDREAIEAIDQLLTTQRVAPAFMARDIEFTKRLTPERLHDDPAILLAAHGLYAVRSKFGSNHDGVNYYSGTLETDPTPAAWRTALHTETVMIDGQRHALKKGLSDAKRLTIMAAAAHHDHNQGDGRGQQEGRDEGNSALTFARLATLYDIDDPDFIAGGMAGIHATLFDEKTRQQCLDPSAGYMDIQLGVAGPDLSVCDRPDGPRQAFGPMIENGCRKETASSFHQVVARDLRTYNQQQPPEQRCIPATIREWLQFIERYGNRSKEYAVNFLGSNGKFMLNHRYPDGYEPGYGYRERNARFWERLDVTQALAEGQLERCYDLALAYAHEPETA